MEENVFAKKIEILKELKEESKKIGANILKEVFVDLDMPRLAMLDRSCHLIEGFIELIKQENLTCMGAILRLQIDNCLKSFAFLHVEEPKKLFNYLIDGKNLSSYKINNKQKMTEKYLRKQMMKIDNKINNVYIQSSKFIHFSEISVFSTFNAEDGNKLTCHIGRVDKEKNRNLVIECIDAFIYFTDLFYNLLNSWAKIKDKINFDD